MRKNTLYARILAGIMAFLMAAGVLAITIISFLQ